MEWAHTSTIWMQQVALCIDISWIVDEICTIYWCAVEDKRTFGEYPVKICKDMVDIDLLPLGL